MQRKPENREIDNLIVNALARHRVLRRRTLAEMFIGISKQKVYSRLSYLNSRGIIEQIHYTEIRGKKPPFQRWEMGMMHYLAPAAPRLLKNDLHTYELYSLVVPPTQEELKWYDRSSRLLHKLPFTMMEDGRRFQCQHLVFDCAIDLVYHDWLIVFERDHAKHQRRVLLENCQLLSDIPEVRGILILCKTEHKRYTLAKFWAQNNGPHSVRFCMSTDYPTVSSILTSSKEFSSHES